MSDLRITPIDFPLAPGERLLRATWFYGSEWDDHAEGVWYFGIPEDWDDTRFRAEVTQRALTWARANDWTYDDLNWGDLLTHVELGSDIREFDLPTTCLTIEVNHDEDLLPEGWNDEASCPDCWGTGHWHERVAPSPADPVVHEDVPCPDCKGTGLTPEENDNEEDDGH